MIGHSDLVPVPGNETPLVYPSPAPRGQGRISIGGLGVTDDMIMATENSDARGMIGAFDRNDYDRRDKPTTNNYRPLDQANMMLMAGTNNNDRTNTMDFIDKIINDDNRQ